MADYDRVAAAREWEQQVHAARIASTALASSGDVIAFPTSAKWSLPIALDLVAILSDRRRRLHRGGDQASRREL